LQELEDSNKEMPDDGWEGVKERSKVVGCLKRNSRPSGWWARI